MKRNDYFRETIVFSPDGDPIGGEITDITIVSSVTGRSISDFNPFQPLVESSVTQNSRDVPHLLLGRKLGVPQAAKAMGVGQTKLRELIREGQLPVIRVVAKILILEKDVETFLQSNYGVIHPTETRKSNSLPPLPKHIRESELLN